MAEDYTVQEGDSVLSIAATRGFTWQTLWNDGANSALKDKRKDPDILMPGDTLHIPDKQTKQESKSDGARHKFKVKNQCAKFKVTLLRQPKDTSPAQTEKEAKEIWKLIEPARPAVKPEPMDSVPYELSVNGKTVDKGNTSSSGTLTAKVSPTANAALLTLNGGKPEERVIELNFRKMTPLSEYSGLGRRLYNLGFACSTNATELTPDLKQALSAFQKREGLNVTGDADDATRNKLKDVYGG